ncbi:MAG: hypothetical protein KC416_11475, partial [Myxococcales bacterium]|nr:hypothetical protein [Myxococcales bacterium]
MIQIAASFRRDERVYESESRPEPGTAEPPTPARVGYPVDPYRVLRAFRRGARVILIASVLGVALGLFIPLFLMPRTWQSRAVLVYEGILADTGETKKTLVADPRDLRTMVDSVKLPTNVRKVQERLGKTDQNVDVFGQKIHATYEIESNLVEIWGEAKSAEEATELTNTMVDVFLEHRKAVDQERLRSIVDGIDKNLRAAKLAEKEARDRYDAFRTEKGIGDLTAERQRSIQAAADLQAKADLAAVNAREIEARITAIRALQGDAPAQATPEPAVTATAADRAALKAAQVELSTALSRYTEEHPTVQAIQARVSRLQAKVGASSGSAGRAASVAALERELSAAREKEAAFRSQADQLRGEVSRYSLAEGDASSLLATVEVTADRVRRL